MTPKIITISEKKLVGQSSTMNHGEYGKIVSLWKQFMPRKKEIKTVLHPDLIAVQIYNDFNAMETPFDIWAATEVSNVDDLPKNMASITIPKGDYAVFRHKGMDASKTYQYIMTEWLPSTPYKIDTRPHFQVMGAQYKNGSPDSEEDFYVPFALKQ
ncbi:GyrI-like domain-containing protein [Winogradskyella eckloniae]|nr:GyrI-like domain-containing protein [Winogradskyella eckloniae]